MLRPEDGELHTHSTTRLQQCIMPSLNAMTVPASASGKDTAVLKQLAESISRQTEETERTNRLVREDIKRSREREESKKDKLENLHRSILNMLKMVASTDRKNTKTHSFICRGFNSSHPLIGYCDLVPKALVPLTQMTLQTE